ncbi:protein of unknown function [Aminobacter niigataensis]|nr:protein of unknown function [Aminobacter niigataensis]
MTHFQINLNVAEFGVFGRLSATLT